MVAPNPIYDFGEVLGGAKIETRFIIQNKGDGHLVIEKLISGCGCVAALAPSAVIPPGEQGELLVSLNTKGLAGSVARGVEVFTNDTDTPILSFSLRGRVTPRVEVVPNKLSFIDVAVGDTGTSVQEVKFILGDSELGKLARDGFSFVSSSPSISCSLTGVTTNEIRAQVRLAQDLETGRIRERLTLVHRDRKLPLAQLPIFAIVGPAVRFGTSRLDFGRVGMAGTKELVAVLRNFGSRPIVFGEPLVASPALTVTLVETEPGWEADLLVKLDYGKFLESLEDEIEVPINGRGENSAFLRVTAHKSPRL